MSVHFKFKSEKEFTTVNFPGTAIRVIDLKRAIVEQKKLNKGLDLELVITDAQNNTGMKCNMQYICTDYALQYMKMITSNCRKIQASL
jgi:hypothetical protein